MLAVGHQESEQRNCALSEPVPISDTFATGVDRYFYDEFVRVVYWAEHPVFVGGVAIMERIVVSKVVMPRTVFEACVTAYAHSVPALGH